MLKILDDEDINEAARNVKTANKNKIESNFFLKGDFHRIASLEIPLLML